MDRRAGVEERTLSNARRSAREAIQLSEYSKQPATLLHVADGTASNHHLHAAALATQKLARGAVARVAVGRPVTEILRAARNTKAQLIVIGAARRTRIGSKLFGTTGQLLRDAKCPILAVPVREVAKERSGDLNREAA